MRTVALVPFKSFSYAKKRLRGSYSDAGVEAIGRAMLEDVLAALTSTPGLEAVWVLTDDPEVARVAEGCGAEARVRRPDPGLNRAIDEANGEAEAFDATLVVLGDTPLLRGEDVEAVLRAGAEGSVVLVPSPDGGTIMLLRRPPHRIAARFGSGSFRKHVEACHEKGFEPLVLDAIPETFRTDLDTPEDAAHILGAGISGRTVEVLRKLHDR